ncbi:MAG: long-chain fatty acid--CoA ligase [Aggregatilineales bacterium]
MQHTMMDYQLTLIPILERAGKLFGEIEVVSRLPDKSLHRQTYADFYRRARALAEMLQSIGLRRSERVATMMWNHYAHLEAYFGIPAAGGVFHTLNFRLAASDIGYIANHAEDRFLIVDDVLLPVYEKFRDQVKFEKVFVVPLTGQPVPAGYESYEALLEHATGKFTYPDLRETDPAGMCYTSGTTGQPKGVVYSHRAIVIHTLAESLPDALDLSQRDTIVPIVPMFHVLAWGTPFAATMLGAKLVLPGPHLDGESVLDLFEREKVTVSAGVPTVWLGVAQLLDNKPGGWHLQPGLRLVVGGSAAPESLIRRLDKHGIQIIHAWGMTEMTPIGTVSRLKSTLDGESEDVKYAYQAKQGLPSAIVEVRAMNDNGEVPWDGATMGELQVRGPSIAAAYYNPTEPPTNWTDDGWFKTGDVVTIDPEGYVQIVDRSKDLIKSGGEWISSVALENALMGHPAVAEAAVVSVSHPKWQERPLAVVVLKAGASATPAELLDFLRPKFAKFWIPDDVVFAQSLPRTSTGKFLKSALRVQYRNYELTGQPVRNEA